MPVTGENAMDHATSRPARAGRRPLRVGAVEILRRAYFADGGQSASRYGIGFDRVLEHLWETRDGQRHRPLRRVRHVDDLIHAVACIDELGNAWTDLTECYERPLVRKCSFQLGQTSSIIAVRRLFTELQRHSASGRGASLPSLRAYRGSQPLRGWLADRLVAMQTRERMTRLSIVAPRKPLVGQWAIPFESAVGER